jgi:hypothetical protein
VGIVQPWEVSIVQQWSPNVRAYDVIHNSSCDNQTDDERILMIYRLTHKDDIQ